MSIFSRRKSIIARPTMGMFDVSGGTCSSDVLEDGRSLGQLFASLSVATDKPPECDVLFIYGDVEPNGTITNCQLGLREIIRDAKASIVVFASDNAGKNYIKAGARKSYGDANLVLTLDRRDGVFAQFFEKLFLLMKQGTSMPEAWVKLAPEGPGVDHYDCPGTIFACELGPIRFA